MTDTKASNPKEAFGDAKMPDGLVPDTAIIEENLAFLEGALKYGQYNWRVVGVKASTYRRAIGRHLKKWWNGQDRDPATLVLELASIRACCGIMIDSIAAGNFVDDRPPRANIERTLDEAAKVAKHLKKLFEGHSPPQYTEREHGVAARGIQGSGLRGLSAAITMAVGGIRTETVQIVPAGTTADHAASQKIKRRLAKIRRIQPYPAARNWRRLSR